MTYTYAVLDVPATVYAAVRALLKAAEYEHAFHEGEGSDGEVIDMHGIALRSKGGELGTLISVSSLVSRRDGQGKVEFQMEGELAQLDLTKAREVVGMLQSAIEAAVSDQLLVQFLREKIGLDQDKATAALMDFREMRQARWIQQGRHVMGQVFDGDGNVLGEAYGATKREVFEKLDAAHPDAVEMRIKTLKDRIDAAEKVGESVTPSDPSIGSSAQTKDDDPG